MTEKTKIVDFLGERALVLPALLNAAIAANERAKYVMSLLQIAAGQAEHPQAPAPTLRDEREACGIAETGFDHAIARAEHDGAGNFVIPGARRLVALLDDSVRTMIAPLAVAGRDSAAAAPLAAGFGERLERLIQARPPIDEDMLSGETIAAIASGRPAAGDGIHLLVMALHKEINRLQAAIATEEIAGAKAYGLRDGDRAAVAAFMRGLDRTRPLKFDHPGLDTLAARDGEALLIQNDIGTTEAHVLVIKVERLQLTLTYSDVHLPRLRFLQALCAATGIVWDDLRSHHTPAIGDELFYMAVGRLTAPDDAALAGFLERIGSRIVFLIDWNKARKRLSLLLPNEAAVATLAWAAEHEFGHRAFLQLGGERLVYDALEQAVKTPLRYGEPLHEMIGDEIAEAYLRFVLETAATGLRTGQSEALIRDRIRAELFTHFRSAEQRLLAACARHAAIIARLADGVRAALRHRGGDREAAALRHATQAKSWESHADDIVREMRATVRRIAGTEVFCGIVETADDAADSLEDATFLARLLGECDDVALPEPLLALADLVAAGSAAFCRTIETAQFVHRGGEREAVQRFLEAADRVVSIEHQSDERERAVTAELMKTPVEARRLFIVSGIARALETATDALLRASLRLRDQVLGDVTYA